MIYIFGRKQIDVSNCVTELTNSIRDSHHARSAERVVLQCDVVYSHIANDIAEQLHAALDRPVHYREIPFKAEPLGQPAHSVAENQRLGATDQASENVLLYIGSDSLSMTNLLITHGSSEVPVDFSSSWYRKLSHRTEGTRLRPRHTTNKDRVAHHEQASHEALCGYAKS